MIITIKHTVPEGRGEPSALKMIGMSIVAEKGDCAFSKTGKHRGSEHFIHEAQIVWIRARPDPNVCRSFRAGCLLSVPRVSLRSICANLSHAALTNAF